MEPWTLLCRLAWTGSLTDGNGRAALEGVALVSGEAGADGHVAPDATLGVLAALVVARVAALVADTGLVAGAVGADDTLGPTVGRTAAVVGQARARRAPVVVATLRVRPARTRLARTGRRLRD